MAFIEQVDENGVVNYVNEDFLPALNGEVAPVTPSEQVFTPSAADLAKFEQISKNNEAMRYLSETDWYVTRQQETGKPIPEDVLQKRAQARLDIVAV